LGLSRGSAPALRSPEKLLVRNELLRFVVATLNQVLDPVGVVGQFIALVLDALDDMSSKVRSIILLIHEEGPANQI
jgi:hypothetical protein